MSILIFTKIFRCSGSSCIISISFGSRLEKSFGNFRKIEETFSMNKYFGKNWNSIISTLRGCHWRVFRSLSPFDMVGLNFKHNFQFSILLRIFLSHLFLEVVVPHFGLVSARIEVLGDINWDRFLKSWELQNEMNFQIIRGNVLLGNVNEISKWKTTEDRLYIFPGVQMQKLKHNTNYQRMPPAYKTMKIIFESLSFITWLTRRTLSCSISEKIIKLGNCG